jgi:hypothetical protein
MTGPFDVPATLVLIISLTLSEDGVQTLARFFMCDYNRRRRLELVKKNQDERLNGGIGHI